MKHQEEKRQEPKRGTEPPSSETREDKLLDQQRPMEERRKKPNVDRTPETGPGGE